MKKIILVIVSIFLISISESYSQGQCFDEVCNGGDITTGLTITYSVNQPYCGSCTYTAFYRECKNNGTSIFIIDSIEADAGNAECCFGTAQNDPILSGFILTTAAELISLTGTGSPNNQYSIFTPSRCWMWEGPLGPYPLHKAVFVPCGTILTSCCRYDYEVIDGVSTLINVEAINEALCNEEGCFQIC